MSSVASCPRFCWKEAVVTEMEDRDPMNLYLVADGDPTVALAEEKLRATSTVTGDGRTARLSTKSRMIIIRERYISIFVVMS